MIKYSLFISALFLTTACASHTAKNVSAAASDAVTDTREGLTDAAMAPLEDLNLRRDEIPRPLQGSDNPYAIPEEMDCIEIARRIGELNGVLGRDWDSEDPEERLRSEQLADAAASATLGAIASEARGLIPFRGMIRKATGAESHKKRYLQAIQIGKERRAYLKGIGLAQDCPAPARPMPMDTEIAQLDNELIYKGDVPTGYLPPAPAPTETIQPAPEAQMPLQPTAPTVQNEGLESVPDEWPF